MSDECSLFTNYESWSVGSGMGAYLEVYFAVPPLPLQDLLELNHVKIFSAAADLPQDIASLVSGDTLWLPNSAAALTSYAVLLEKSLADDGGRRLGPLSRVRSDFCRSVLGLVFSLIFMPVGSSDSSDLLTTLGRVLSRVGAVAVSQSLSGPDSAPLDVGSLLESLLGKLSEALKGGLAKSLLKAVPSFQVALPEDENSMEYIQSALQSSLNILAERLDVIERYGLDFESAVEKLPLPRDNFDKSKNSVLVGLAQKLSDCTEEIESRLLTYISGLSYTVKDSSVILNAGSDLSSKLTKNTPLLQFLEHIRATLTSMYACDPALTKKIIGKFNCCFGNFSRLDKAQFAVSGLQNYLSKVLGKTTPGARPE